jgi:hypothetical protein
MATDRGKAEALALEAHWWCRQGSAVRMQVTAIEDRVLQGWHGSRFSFLASAAAFGEVERLCLVMWQWGAGRCSLGHYSLGGGEARWQGCPGFGVGLLLEMSATTGRAARL